MAIVKMKRFYLLAMQADKEKLLKTLQQLGSVQITDAVEEAKELMVETGSPQNTDLDRLRWAINYIGKYSDEKKPLFATDVYISRTESEEALSNASQMFDIVKQAEELEREFGKLNSQKLKLNSDKDELKPWLAMDIPLNSIKNTNDTVQFLGYIQNASLDKLKESEALADSLVYTKNISVISGTSYMLVVVHKDDYNKINKLFKDYGFTNVNFANIDTNAQTAIEDIDNSLAEADKAEKDIINKLTELSKNIHNMQILYDVLKLDDDRYRAVEKFVNTSSTFYAKGWIPEKSVATMEEELKKVSSAVSIEVMEPEEGDVPPVLLHNNKFVTPFESVVTGFSLPSPDSIDPSAVMAPFFANFFGMMLSDAGYALIMLIAIPIILKKYKPKLVTRNMLKLMIFGAIATVIWGALYNTWFGFGLFPQFALFDAVNKPMPVMLACVAIGAVHLFTGLIVAAYMNIKNGDVLAAVYDQLSWALLLIGLGLMVVPNLSNIGQILALVGAALIVLFAGREKKNFFGRILSGFGALYGMSSWISDLLSYMRLFGMGLATGVIGMVINKLIGTVFEAGIIGVVIGSVLFIFAHIFNLGINALGAYVHSCRLQYIEFFSKFFVDGGKEFKPLSENTRYIKIVEDKNLQTNN
ncbi:MAG: V-type ATP synthase subunit I [Christensenellaceae bacterium]|nr:V-type ATP synthase subunit I [Christensenellaceae bacterium]